MRGTVAWPVLCLLVVLLVSPLLVKADEVRFDYDRSGNVIAIQRASATALAVKDVRPGFGAPNDVVTIVGTGFGSSASANLVSFNGVAAAVLTASSNVLTVSVPAGATSGSVSVTVGSTTVQSPRSFIVLPSGVAAANVSNVVAMTLDGNALDVASVGSRNLVLAFTLPQSKYVSLHMSSLLGDNPSSISYTVYAPSGSAIASGTFGTATPDILLPNTQTAGVYTVYVKPQGWIKTHVALTSDPELVVNGAAWSLAPISPSQKRRAWFSGTAGQNMSVGITGLSVTPSSANAPTYTWYQPNGSTLSLLTNLPATGAYAVMITAGSNATATSLQYWLSADITGAFQLNTATNLAVTRPGQHVRYTFQGSTGDHIRFGTTATNAAPIRLATYVFDPSGTAIISGGYFNSTTGNNATASATLSATGTYTVLLQPNPYDNPYQTWSTTFAVSKDVDAPLTIDGPSTSASTVVVGQEIRATFSATAGQNLCFGYSNFSVTPSNATGPIISIYKPDGTALSSLVNLPQAGTYTIVAMPTDSTLSSSMQLWLSTEQAGTLAYNTAISFAVTRPGQRVRYTFQGAQGDHVRFGTTATNATPIRLATYVFDPSGNGIISGGYFNSTTGSNATASATLSATGTYTVLLQPNPYDNPYQTWSTTFAVSKDVDAPLTIDGPSTPASTTVVGQEIRATFSATAGQNLGLGISNVSLAPSGAYIQTTTLYKPDGTALSSWINLPQTGTYTIVIKPTDSASTSSMQLWLSTEVTGTLALNTATPLSVSRPGQHGRYTFQGTQGQVVTFTATSPSSNPANQTIAVYGYKPDGSSLIGSGYFVASSDTTTYTTGTLPATGTYSVYIAINPYDNIYATWATTLTVAPH